MHRIRNVRLGVQGMSTVLLLAFALAPSSAQVMRRRPSPPTPTVVAPAPPAPMVIQKPPTPPPPAAPQGGGVAQLTPAAACISNSTPRISNINGTQSGIVFQPGSQLNIAGCGFGRGGQVYLSGSGITVPMKINSWDDSNIHATIDPALGGVADLGAAKVNVKPNGLPGLGSIETHSFQAARAQFVLALPPNAAGAFSQLYGPPVTSNDGAYRLINDGLSASSNAGQTGMIAAPGRGTPAPRPAGGMQAQGLAVSASPPSPPYTRILRSRHYERFCPAATDQAREMTDSWPVDFLANGFEVVDVNYKNLTLQKNQDTPAIQWVLVGGSQGATRYDAVQRRLFVTFQGNSMYVKKASALDIVADLATLGVNAAIFSGDLINDLKKGGSACTSDYTVALSVSGPRGISPYR